MSADTVPCNMVITAIIKVALAFCIFTAIECIHDALISCAIYIRFKLLFHDSTELNNYSPLVLITSEESSGWFRVSVCSSVRPSGLISQ